MTILQKLEFARECFKERKKWKLGKFFQSFETDLLWTIVKVDSQWRDLKIFERCSKGRIYKINPKVLEKLGPESIHSYLNEVGV
jgi:hemerythrin superfamily protein